MSNKYVGITIGPVVETLTLSSSPMALWFSSYLFSYISKSICKELINHKISTSNDFVVPFVNDEILNSYSYVGLYHDRIIISVNEPSLSKVQDVILDIKKSVANSIALELSEKNVTKVIDYITKYLQIFAIEKDLSSEENPILELSKLLDAIELTKTHIPVEEENYILSFMNNDNNSANKNQTLKNSFLVKNIVELGPNSFPLFKKNNKSNDDNNVITITDIANKLVSTDLSILGDSPSATKISNYYAIIQADGDGIGEVIKNLNGNESLFSKRCLDFGKRASEEIYSYGGVPIYAGGDDLLFIAPLQGHNSKNIFDLIKLLSETFNENIKTETSNPSMSFGIAVHYVKFPLYEAFSNAIDLLFGKAKKFQGKNAVAINFQKHSGQSFGFVFRKEDQLINKFSQLILATDTTDNSSETSNSSLILHSVSKKIVEHSKLFEIAIISYMDTNEKKNCDLIDNLFSNIFDSEIHSDAKFSGFIEDIKELLKSFIKSNSKGCNPIIEYINQSKSSNNIHNINTDNKNLNQEKALDILKSLDSLLRMVYFFNEEKKVIPR